MASYPDPGKPEYCARCATAVREETRGGRLRPVCPACGWVYYAKNATGAAILIEAEDRVLLVQRKHDPYQGHWMLPAGFVEYGERPEETAVREAQEECGLVVALTALWNLYFGTDDPRNVSSLVVYRARLVGGTLRPGDDAAAARFFRRGELPAQIAFQAHREALRDWERTQPSPPRAARGEM